ncbi:MAG TPA: LysM peptidoglycan-binding domain-containing protein [Tepidisphaeraceae bacterium]
MKRLLPVVLAVASFTIVGCKPTKRPNNNPPPVATDQNPSAPPTAYQPPPDNGNNMQPEPNPGPAPMPSHNGGEATTVHHTTHHHAVAAARHGKYVVKRGDTLSKIAHAHHVSLKRLEAANPHVDPNKIHVGQTLNIP